MKELLSSKGFSALEVALVVIVMGIIGGTGYFVYDSQKEANQLLDSADASAQVEAEVKSIKLTEQYDDPVGNFSLMYPKSWKLDASVDKTDKEYPSSDAKITSPKGSVLVLGSDYGGKGGMCEPEEDDVPFAAGNTCASLEYLSVEQLPIDNVFYAASAGNKVSYKKANVALVTSHYAAPDGKAEYQIGVTNNNPEYPIAVNVPEMGLVGISSLSVYDSSGKSKPYIYAKAVGSNEAFLKSDDAKVIMSILRTLKIKT